MEEDKFDKLGFDKEVCPKCQQRLYNKICLNGCGLPGGKRNGLPDIIEFLKSSQKDENSSI